MEYSKEEKCWLWLATLPGIGPVLARKLVDALGSAEAVRREAERDPERLPVGLEAETVRQLKKTLSPDYPDRLAAALTRRGITAIAPCNAAYSPLLAELPDAPILLYAIGDVSLLRSPGMVAVVGSRATRNYGQKIAYQLGRDMALQGVTVVSGMARGADTCAHTGALDAGGKTVAVLGCGVDVVYPPENRELYERIKAEGLLISEYMPGTEPFKGHFPERNRIISGLCHGVVVVDGGEKSGTRITAGLALEQGREVMAVPGNVDTELSFTPNQLIREGCALVASAKDVLEALGWREAAEEPPKEKAPVPSQEKPRPTQEEEKPIHVTPGKPTEDEKRIMEMLTLGPAAFNEIYEALEFSPAKLGATLTIMVAKGMLKALPGKVYEIQ